VSRLRILLFLYGIVNAAAYCCLLPLWEGFDEAYHYSYVQYLSTNLRFPVLGRATLSQEVWHSLQLVPVSHYLQPFTRAPVNFNQYFGFSEQERLARRRQLKTIPLGEKFISQPDKPNYEVNQSPAAYLLLAILDRALSSWPLPDRVLALRFIASIAGVGLVWQATFSLASELSLEPVFACAVLVCVFSSQMFYATLCRVSNDTLAVPAMGYLLLAAVRAQRRGTRADWLTLGLAMALGLLIKAYFLFVAPLALFLIGVALWRQRAGIREALYFAGPVALMTGPWYIRNVVLYGSVSATVEQTSGLDIRRVLTAATAVPWLESIRYMAHSSLWTGNNSFTTFSAATLNIVLLLLAAGVTLYFARARRDSAGWILAAAVALFSGGLALITIAFFAGSHGQVFAAVPWYMQVLLVPVLLIAFAGLQRAGIWGSAIAALSVLLWGYVMAASYLAKLIPLYGGFMPPHARLASLWSWYLHHSAERDALLRTVCPGGLVPVVALIAFSLAVMVASCAVVVAGIALREHPRAQA
jgi:hypothetical protein